MISDSSGFFSYMRDFYSFMPLEIRLCIAASFGLFVFFGVLKMVRR